MKKEFNIITIGGATQDIFLISNQYQVKDGKLQLDWGEKFLADRLFTDVGGGACNSAVGFSRLGLSVAFWGKVGMDIPGQVIAQRLKEEKVSIKLLVIDEKAQTSTSAVLVGKGGERAIVMYRGDNDDLLTHTPSFDLFTQTEWIYLSDLGAHTESFTFKILDLVTNNNSKLAFVPGQHQLKQGIEALKPILSKSTILILNIYEAYQLLYGSYPGEEKESCHTNEGNILKMLKEFYQLGPRYVVITRDKCGVSAYDGRSSYQEASPAVDKVTDTTGAGDAFASAFITAIIKEKDIRTALSWGNKNAGSVIASYGAQYGLLKLSQLE
ncbi:carbohydrate kinase family protein [Candidatus Parcubacteria bacterium]|nr:carbohydrate kinase family protein [Patescibacteria group bacterium]MBU4380764.1 carbohydrate kinase family protein [Patescibacteria group bacterium]MCG2688846.1 carbohydrate kinase family protein [Candidatus Parcubacteria bacterium]